MGIDPRIKDKKGGSFIRMLIKDGKQRRKGEQKTAEGRKGKTFANKLPFLAWTSG